MWALIFWKYSTQMSQLSSLTFLSSSTNISFPSRAGGAKIAWFSLQQSRVCMWSHTQWSTFTHSLSTGILQKWCYCYTIVSPIVTLSTSTITPSPHTLPLTFSLALFTHLHPRFPPSTGTTMITLHSFQGATPSFLMATCPSSLGWRKDWRFIWTTPWDG